MASLNRVLIIGNLGRDPEVKFIPNGKAVCNFSVATTEKWGKGEEKNEKTEWHKVVVWGNQAEMCGRYLSKGRSVYVEGRIQTREYEKDGSKRYVTEIVADRVQFLGGRGESSGGGGGSRSSGGDDFGPPPSDDESVTF